MTKTLAGTLLAGALLASAPALAADDFTFHTRQGPVTVTVHRDGRVTGFYPWNNGKMVGRVDPDHSLSGVWLQTKSDRACREPRDGTYYWGRFYISDPYRRPVRGFYGYCGQRADLDWGSRHERY